MNEANPILVFDRALVRTRRTRAAVEFGRHNVLFRESAEQLLERLGDINQVFGAALDLGAHDGLVGRSLIQRGMPLVVSAELSEKMISRESGLRVVCDEENLPFGSATFDLVTSNLSLHWVNDLPGALAQIRLALKPGGLFLAALIGGQSLPELRGCLIDAELAVTGGVSPRTSPTIDLPTASGLLQRAGFALPVADSEKIVLTYSDAFAVMRDLRGMGETNAHRQRLRRPTRRQVLFEAASLYAERFSRTDGTVPASFDILFLHGVGPLRGGGTTPL